MQARARAADVPGGAGQGNQAAHVVGAVGVLADTHTPKHHGRWALRVRRGHLAQQRRGHTAQRGHGLWGAVAHRLGHRGQVVHALGHKFGVRAELVQHHVQHGVQHGHV